MHVVLFFLELIVVEFLRTQGGFRKRVGDRAPIWEGHFDGFSMYLCPEMTQNMTQKRVGGVKRLRSWSPEGAQMDPGGARKGAGGARSTPQGTC